MPRTRDYVTEYSRRKVGIGAGKTNFITKPGVCAFCTRKAVTMVERVRIVDDKEETVRVPYCSQC